MPVNRGRDYTDFYITFYTHSLTQLHGILNFPVLFRDFSRCLTHPSFGSWKSQTVPLRHVQCFPLLGLLWELRCHVCSHRFRQSTVHVCNIACIVSDRIFVLFRLLRLVDNRYSYRNNTRIPILLSPDVSIVVSSVSRVTLLGLSFRQYSFYLCRYVHLAVQSQPDN